MAVIHSDAPPVHRPWRRNFGFGLGSLLLLLGTIWLVYFDYSREWKVYQREFRDLEIDKAEAHLLEVQETLSADKDLAALEQQLEQARGDLEAREGDLEAARRALLKTEKDFYVAEQNWKEDKSFYDAQKYEFEEEHRQIEESSLDDAAKEAAIREEEEHFEEFEDQYQEAVLALEEATLERAGARESVKALTRTVDEREKEIAALTARETALLRKLDAIEPTFRTFLLNAPVLDMAAPTLKIDQVILPHLQSDINFMTIPKVDRCVTCHKGIMDPAYERDAQPFAAHPKLDLYLTDGSPHPYTKFGCTICHQGLDRATSFESAMHTPRGEEQERDWKERYGWQAPHYWDFPQLQAQHAQASCRTCHIKEVRVEGAGRYNQGLDLLERGGCFGCHKIAGYEGRRGTGPTLRRLASKVDADWAYRWVEDPRSYRPNTWMPRFFHLTNTNTPEDRERSEVEIASIVSYLFARSEPFEPSATRAPAGDAVRGRRLVAEKGCMGCHRIGENPTTRGTFGRDFGPALDRVGDKVTAEWLFDWVRNPKRYFAETNMPDLRLTDGEAADITAYLMTLTGPAPKPAPGIDETVLDDVATEFLIARLTHEQARERLASMSLEEKKTYLGEKLIGHRGCFGCHDIPGFEEALPIGTELSNEGTKMITRLDFGFVHIPHTKPAWFYQKMKDPRIFDNGKVKRHLEKLKMPDFGFTDEEADTLVTVILSMQKDVQPLESHHLLDERKAAVEAGRRIIQDRNCRGCHILEGEGGAIQEVIADQAYYPPNLFGEGDKVQSDWLFSFLREPTPIRPWLQVRMPTFHFEDPAAATITKYFASVDEATYPFHTVSVEPLAAEVLQEGRRTFEQFKCMSCHPIGPPPASVNVAELAPDLTMARSRLRHDWIVDWLRDPQKLMPGTRMPGFFYSDGSPLYPDADERMRAVKEYLLRLDRSSQRASSFGSTGQ